jgi:hypothetical protein
MTRIWSVLLTLCLCTVGTALGQGLDTTASQTDWEEINFEFDSDVLTDGYPSLLRLADLLTKNPAYSVELIGHADYRGGEQYNQGLGGRRAEMVKAFLVKYSAQSSQITTRSQGEATPSAPNESPEGRFINRRVVIVARDADGQLVSDGSVGDAINGIERLSQQQEDCCNRIMEKLSKLDDILDLLKDLKRENQQLKQDVAELKQGAAGRSGQNGAAGTSGAPGVAGQPASQLASTGAGTDSNSMTGLPAAPSSAASNSTGSNLGQYATFNLDAGPTAQTGNLSVTGRGRVFVPFAQNHAFQSQGEYMHFLGRDEGQFDVGLVSRWGDIQLGGFSSFKYVKFSEFDQGGGLGQGAVTADYLFDGGRVGLFGTKSFMDGAILNRESIRRNVIEESYLDVVDQFGFSTAIAAWGPTYFEGNVGAMFRENGTKPGGMIRYVHPLNKAQTVAFTVEGGLNETMISGQNDGRFVVGLQLGKWLSPNKYKSESNGSPVPVDIPRVRYEVLKRQIRTGNDLPVADAGPDIIGIAAGAVVLDGSGSFDPDGDPITFEWIQIGGDTVELAGASSAQASFTAEEGKNYFFRLTVKDDQGGTATDRVTVSADAASEIIIKRFRVEPGTVEAGDLVTIVWEVEGADEVEISGLGIVGTSGQSSLPITETTVFTLTARSGEQTASESQTVQVADQALPQIVQFGASPTTVESGQPSVLSWNVEGADTVEISGIGNVDASGSTSVTPTSTTSYTLIARNAVGEATSVTTISVLGSVRIIEFRSDKTTVAKPGEPATLSWSVEGAERVELVNFGEVSPTGSQTVNPNGQTLYTLIAYGSSGEATATVILDVENENLSPIARAWSQYAVVGQVGDTSGFGVLHGEGSSDPDGDPISYEWRSVGSRTAQVADPSSPTPTVEFLGGFGAYTFELKVTDDKGFSGFTTVVVRWLTPQSAP